MNKDGQNGLDGQNFLNDVCRHEQKAMVLKHVLCFLNDVCRHEPKVWLSKNHIQFLNDVCRHEL